MEMQSFSHSSSAKNLLPPIGSPQWNDFMFSKYPTPTTGVTGIVKNFLAASIFWAINKYGKFKNKKRLGILEIGCEAGFLLDYLSKKIPEACLVGSDISKSALEKARSKLSPSIRLFYHDISKEPFRFMAEPFDIIICSETLEHIPDVQKAIYNLAETASNQTLIIITVPDQHTVNMLKKLMIKLRIFNLLLPGLAPGTSEWHVHYFTKRDLKNLLKQVLEIVAYRRLPLHHLFIAKKSFKPK